MTVRDLLLARADDDRPGLLFEDRSWSWREHVSDCAALAAGLTARLDAARPPHVGALLDNTPEMAALVGAAGLGGPVLVGLNPTRRGPALAADIGRTDVQVVVTESRHAPALEGLDLEVPVLVVGSPEWESLVATPADPAALAPGVAPDDLMMLILTSGTSGDPKAVRVTQEKVAHPARLLSERFGLSPDDVCYLSMPMFHSNAVMAGWGPGLAGGSTLALARRFTASGFLDDVRRFGATYANYVGKPLTYVLATPERDDDADNPLRLVFGNEAAERDIAAFGERFGCVVVDSYSSTENAVIVQRVPEMPPGSLGRPLPGVAVLDPVTHAEVPDAEFDEAGRLVNGDVAVGELVNTAGAGFFAGYYNDPEADADRMRGGMYWSGDLAYRDADGFVFFAGRTADWLRVDGENLATAPIERVLLRHPDVQQAAVYAGPDPSGVGDQVMAALVLREGAGLTPDGLQEFLAEQPDLGAKSWPRWVRLAESLPQTPTNKVLKRQLAAEHLDTPDTIWARVDRTTAYHPR